MLTRLDLRDDAGPVASRLPRPGPPAEGPVDEVRAIVAAVRERGDEALRELTLRFDGAEPETLTVAAADIAAAEARTPPAVRDALAAAAANVEAYHRHQLLADVSCSSGGLHVSERHLPVRRAGCYVPGGRAAYPSTVIMTAVPARVAGVEEIALCTPPGPDGRVADVTLAAAAAAGVGEVHPVGGAQAVAALAFGTESIPAVDVIVGPGNVYVALAQREVAGAVGVPSAFAGPSEVVVVADSSADATFAAADVILQAEHGPDGLAWLVTWDEAAAGAVEAEVARLAAAADRRAEIEATLANSGHSVLCRSPEQALEVVNEIAPEHLELLVADPDGLLDGVYNAGAVFCGPWAPACLGDYAAGPNHVLPTNGTARFAGSLGVRDFLKSMHVVRADRSGLERLAPHVITLATAEGLTAHADAVRVRLDALEAEKAAESAAATP